MKFNLKQKMGKGLAKEVAKRISKDEFLEYLVDFWPAAFEKSAGALDIEAETKKMKKRLRDSGYWEIFQTMGVTEKDLVETLKTAAEKYGKAVKADEA